MKYTVMLGFFASSFVLFNCGSCIEVQHKSTDLDLYRSSLQKVDNAEKALVEHITKRTVRVVIKCTIYDTRTNKAYNKKYTNYDAGWGTGAIVHSNYKYSLIQTAAHVVANKDIKRGFFIRKCTGFKIERRDINNKIIDAVESRTVVAEIDKKYDIAVIKVYHDFGVQSRFASKIYLGQSIRIVGYPSIRYVNGKHLSYERGHIGTVNTNYTSIRWGVAAYFGNSGGAVWNQQGEIVGTVVSLGGFRTLLGDTVPQQNQAFGPDVYMLRAFYIGRKMGYIVNH